jgi:hypothetical protein
MSGEDSSYQAYTARKASRLSRPKLDCGCPKGGPVYGHLWCDRLACSDHADDVHDCSAFGGAKDGIGKAPEPVVLPPGVLTDEEFLEALDGAPGVDAFLDELAGAIIEARADAPQSFRCRGCRLWIAQDVKLCGPCSALPSCLAERSAVEWGGLVKCFRPAGHDGQHESVQGRCWMDEPSPVEPLQPAVCGALPAFVLPPGIGSCRLPAGHPSWRQHMDERGTSFRDTAKPPRREPFLMEPAPEVDVEVHRYECPHAGCSWVKVALNRDLLLDLAEAHGLAAHARRPWWKRWLP